MEKVLITGASSGIGKELAYSFARKGYSLVLLSKTKDKLEKICVDIERKHTVSCQLVCVDLSNEITVQSFLAQLHPVDIVINCAGIGTITELLLTTGQQEKMMTQLNAITPARITKAYTKEFLKKGSGVVLNVCSTTSLYPQPYLTTYSASKSYLYAYSLSLSEEVKRINPNVHILTTCPGPTRTPFFSKQQRERMTKHHWDKWFEMDAKDVADRIVNQIENRKRVLIIGKRNQLLSGLLKFLPHTQKLKWTAEYLKKGIDI